MIAGVWRATMDIVLTASSRNALLAIQISARQVATTQKHLETGKKVNDAIDDAVKYYQSQALTDRASEFDDLKTNIDQSVSLLQATSVGLTSVENIYKQMKGLLQTAKTATDASTLTNLATQWNQLLNQANSIATDASYQGQNLVQSSDSNAWGNTDGKQVQVSPDANEPKVGIQASILPPYNNTNQYVGYEAAVVNTNAPISIDQTIANVSGGANQNEFQDTTGFGIAFYDICSGNDPVVYQDQQTGDYYANDGINSYQLTNTTITQQSYPEPPPTIGAGTSVQIIQATVPAMPGVNLAAGTYNFCLDDSVIMNAYLGQNNKGYPTNSPPTPTNCITQQSPTLDWASAFGNFNGSINITTAETACDNSISFVQSLQSYYGGKNTLLLTRMDFASNMTNTLTTGSDKITLADLDEESADLQASEIREQIGQQSLSISGNSVSALIGILIK